MKIFWLVAIATRLILVAAVENCENDIFDTATETADGSLIAYGETATYYGANITTFMTGSCEGPIESVGFAISAPEGLLTWMGSLPNEMETTYNVTDACKDDPLGLGCIPPNDLIALNFPGENQTFKWLGLNWNPLGHPPMQAYNLAHFDMHFYLESQDTINSIVPSTTEPCTEGLSAESFYKANVPVPAACFPKGYANLNAVAPFMGNHYVFLKDPVIDALFKGAPNASLWNDPAFIMGGYDGDIVFYEPMVRITTLGDLVDQNQGKKCYSPSVPTEFTNSGYYPSAFCLNVVDNETLVVTLEDMTLQENQGCTDQSELAEMSYINALPPPPGTPPLPEYCKAPLLTKGENNPTGAEAPASDSWMMRSYIIFSMMTITVLFG
ncbi:hypothetical protein M9434_000671 [Picochlorum sp. BPE23]|nr:hypothetical protein M9434_000671 [Picochlorum sp. BPE23]